MAEDVSLKLFVFNATGVVGIDDLEEWVNVLALNGNLQFCDEVGYFINGEVATLVEVEVAENLAEEVGVFTCELPNAGSNFSE